MTDLPVVIPADALAALAKRDLPTLLPPDPARVAQVLESAIAPNTWRAYKRAWVEFLAYCQRVGLQALPADPENVRDYLVALASTPRPKLRGKGPRSGLPSVSLIEQHVAALSTLHRWAGHASPCSHPIVALTVKGIKAERARAGDRKRPKRAARAPLVRRLLDAVGTEGLLACRDRAILLLLAERGLRRSEASGLNLGDVEPFDGGWRVFVRVHKTDQTGERPRTVPLHADAALGRYCPATALGAWVRQRQEAAPAAPLFVGVRGDTPVTWDRWGGQGRLRPAGVGEVIKRAARAAGLPDAEVADLGAHSLRRGKITDDARAGVDMKRIADEVGHKSITTTAGYVEEARLEDPDAWTSAAARIAQAQEDS